MNHSMYGADRLTHLKIVVLALLGATVVAGVGIAARGTDNTSAAVVRAQSEGKIAQGYGPVVKAGGPMLITARDVPTIR
jgi:hypothetical protein